MAGRWEEKNGKVTDFNFLGSKITTHGHHQIVDTEIRLIIFFAAKGGEALYSQQKQHWKLAVALIMNPL